MYASLIKEALHPIMIFNDLSASMSFGQASKLERAAEIAKIIKNSAYQNSDAIGLVGFHDTVDDKWVAPLSYRPYLTESLIKKIALEKNQNKGSNAILKLHQYLPKDHTLIFFISDFHMPIDEITVFLNNTRKHTVVRSFYGIRMNILIFQSLVLQHSPTLKH